MVNSRGGPSPHSERPQQFRQGRSCEGQLCNQVSHSLRAPTLQDGGRLGGAVVAGTTQRAPHSTRDLPGIRRRSEGDRGRSDGDDRAMSTSSGVHLAEPHDRARDARNPLTTTSGPIEPFRNHFLVATRPLSVGFRPLDVVFVTAQRVLRRAKDVLTSPRPVCRTRSCEYRRVCRSPRRSYDRVGRRRHRRRFGTQRHLRTNQCDPVDLRDLRDQRRRYRRRVRGLRRRRCNTY